MFDKQTICRINGIMNINQKKIKGPEQFNHKITKKL